MMKYLTCIICPMGCSLNVEFKDGKVLCVTGNTCPRGSEYAQNECLNPQRTVTSTVRSSNGSVISVKTDRAIPKDMVFECMKIINSTVTDLPVSIGDVIIKDVFGANVVATENVK